MAAAAPQRVGAYQLERELARGGMGVVYVARHPDLDRQVAVKWLLQTDRSRLQRFTEEARLVAQLNHPNIVKIHEAGLEGDRPWFAMELVDGEPLDQRLGRVGALDQREAARIAHEVAQALGHAHERAILHRDVKPGNVLIEQDGRALLTDFGLGKELSEERERLTRTGQMVGTPNFMPPEQALGELEAVGPASDVYGLGATLYAMLTGDPPFEGESLMILIAAITKRPPPSPSATLPVDAALEAICLKCLAKDPAARYPTGSELAEDLRRYLAGEQVALPGTRRPRVKLLLIIALVLVAGGVLGWSALQPKDESDSAEQVSEESPAREEQVAVPKYGTGPAWQAEARAFLARYPDHPRSVEVRQRYLLEGLKDPRRVTRLSSTHGIDALPNDQLLVRAAELEVWDLQEGKRLRVVSRPRPNVLLDASRTQVLFSDNRLVGSVSLEHGGRQERYSRMLGELTEVFAVSLRGDRMAIATPAGRVVLLNTRTWKEVKLLQTRRVTIVRIGLLALSADASVLVLIRERKKRPPVGGFDTISLEAWDIEKDERLYTREYVQMPTFVTMHPDGRRVLMGWPRTNQVVLFEIRDLEVDQEYLGEDVKVPELRGQKAAHNGTPKGGVFSPDGRRLYTISAGGTAGGELRVWDVQSGVQVAQTIIRQAGFLRISLSPDGSRLVTVTGSRFLEVWDVDVSRP